MKHRLRTTRRVVLLLLAAALFAAFNGSMYLLLARRIFCSVPFPRKRQSNGNGCVYGGSGDRTEIHFCHYRRFRRLFLPVVYGRNRRQPGGEDAFA